MCPTAVRQDDPTKPPGNKQNNTRFHASQYFHSCNYLKPNDPTRGEQVNSIFVEGLELAKAKETIVVCVENSEPVVQCRATHCVNLSNRKVEVVKQALTHLGQQEEHPVTELHGAVEKDAGKNSLHQGNANLSTTLKIHQLHGTKTTTCSCVEVDKLDICHIELVIGKMRYKVQVLAGVLQHIEDGLKV